MAQRPSIKTYSSVIVHNPCKQARAQTAPAGKGKDGTEAEGVDGGDGCAADGFFGKLLRHTLKGLEACQAPDGKLFRRTKGVPGSNEIGQNKGTPYH
eukprot:1147537-Pelagomonas_calceolata.AAC.5